MDSHKVIHILTATQPGNEVRNFVIEIIKAVKIEILVKIDLLQLHFVVVIGSQQMSLFAVEITDEMLIR